jgi:hypothetical protein
MVELKHVNASFPFRLKNLKKNNKKSLEKTPSDTPRGSGGIGIHKGLKIPRRKD